MTRDNTPVPITGGMVRGLLALLALEPTRTVPVDDLVDLMWDSTPPVAAVSLLGSYASRLRTQLRGDAQPPPVPGPLVVAERGGYRLGLDPRAVDLVRFDQMTTAGQRALRDGNLTVARRTLEAALRCWRGPALADLDPRFWQLPAVVAAQDRNADAAVAYADCCAAAGSPEMAVELVTAAVRLSQTHEELHARLMRAQTAAGDRAGAIETYLSIRARLADEVGVGVGAQLESAYLALLHDEAPPPDEAPLHDEAPPPDEAPLHDEAPPPVPVVAGARPAARPERAESADHRGRSSPSAVDDESRSPAGDHSVPGTGDGAQTRLRGSRAARRRSSVAVGLVALSALFALFALFDTREWYGHHVHPPDAPTTRQAAPTDPAAGRSFVPGTGDGWQYGPVLGLTPGGGQWFSAQVSGLGHYRLAGAWLRTGAGPDPYRDRGSSQSEVPGAGQALRHGGSGEGTGGGVVVAVSKDEFVIDAPEPDFERGPLRLPSEGLLRISISEGNLIVVTFNGEVVLRRQLHGRRLAGRGIAPAAWQIGSGVRLTGIRSNAVSRSIVQDHRAEAP